MNIYCRAGGRFHKRMEQAIICRHNFVDKIMHARGRRQKYFHYNLVKIVDGEIIFNNLAKVPAAVVNQKIFCPVLGLFCRKCK